MTNLRASQDSSQVYEASTTTHRIDGMLGDANQDDGLDAVLDSVLEFVVTFGG